MPELAALSECSDSLDIAIFNSPRRPHKGAPLRALITSETDLGQVSVVFRKPDGAQFVVAPEAFGGPPWGWVAQVDAPEMGRWRIALVAGDGKVVACQDTRVRRKPSGSDGLEVGVDGTWRSRIKWERDTENLYSLWVERLFLAPLDEDVSWSPLSEVIRDPARNMLFNYMGLDEDVSKVLRLAPDCADFPYFTRAYFAWKLGLPFGYRKCRRGNGKRPPRCSKEVITNANFLATDVSKVASMKTFLRKLKGGVHSSSLRSEPEDENSDFYPVALTRKGLRPGTIYTDPYGHTMMVGRWYPQEEGKAGVLMAIDAQPDTTIGRRVFWRGSFMFPEDDALKGAGWKRFRPIRKERDVGLEAKSNAWISENSDYADFSVEQWARGKEGFYESMDAVINPVPMAPRAAMIATIDALDQQLRRRVESVENGEGWKRDHPGKAMKMPPGAKIFITSGPWEDFSTPSRDMRLLIAMDTVLGFPQRVKRHPERFALPEGQAIGAIVAELETNLKSIARGRHYTYKRSDGSTWKLTMEDLLERIERFESSYNPNDCVEHRWGARSGSDEYATCKTRAPAAQAKAMSEYSAWFQRRERPGN